MTSTRPAPDEVLTAADLHLARDLSKRLWAAFDGFRIEHADGFEPKHAVAGLALLRGLLTKEARP